jgi:hypothetical protein
MQRVRRYLSLLLCLAACAPIHAQTDAASPVPPASADAHPAYNAHDALTIALQHLDDAEKDVRRFIYILDIAMANIGRGGRTRDLSTRKYETTYINGHPYMRLLEKDGAPLTGKDLKDEQKRYDKAVAKKKDLGVEKRADTDDYSVLKPDFTLKSVLDSAHTLTVIDAGLVKDEPTHLIEATPIHGAKRTSTCPWHVRLWIADKTGNLRRYVADTAGDNRPECEKEIEDTRYIEVDGLPKISSSAARFNLPEGEGRYYTAKSVDTYTNYRRFGATVTIRNGDVIAPDAPQAAPAP